MIVLYLVLGTFMEELSMMFATIPITTPLIVAAGYDPVWYGRGTLSQVERGAAPFVVALLAMIAIICIWPDTVMFLPRLFG